MSSLLHYLCYVIVCCAVILSKFWEEVLRCSRASEGVGEGANSSGEQASLMSLLQLLSSTDYGNVVMYAR